MASQTLISRASRNKTKLAMALQAAVLEVEDVSYQHVGHAAVRGMEGGAKETHVNLKIVSSNFEGQIHEKRHCMVYELLSDKLQSGLHALSITAKTPKAAGLDKKEDIGISNELMSFCETELAYMAGMQYYFFPTDFYYPKPQTSIVTAHHRDSEAVVVSLKVKRPTDDERDADLRCCKVVNVPALTISHQKVPSKNSFLHM